VLRLNGAVRLPNQLVSLNGSSSCNYYVQRMKLHKVIMRVARLIMSADLNGTPISDGQNVAGVNLFCLRYVVSEGVPTIF
jgi:hypothetical protein